MNTWKANGKVDDDHAYTKHVRAAQGGLERLARAVNHTVTKRQATAHLDVKSPEFHGGISHCNHVTSRTVMQARTCAQSRPLTRVHMHMHLRRPFDYLWPQLWILPNHECSVSHRSIYHGLSRPCEFYTCLVDLFICLSVAP